MKESFMILAGIACLIAFLSLVSQEIKKAKAIAEKEENQTKKYVYDQVLDLAETIVASLNQTFVEPLKESETLEFDEKAREKVLNDAKEKIKKDLDAKSKELLKDYLGSEENLDDYIDDAVHRRVNEAKKEK
uniref:hypothetical protein n=1 Tax=Anaerococcus mediterraneensis TaxID=1870984 RepID=UPI00093173DA|nr:hypothetical protein [Anaerococcus mediterraneensis]